MIASTALVLTADTLTHIQASAPFEMYHLRTYMIDANKHRVEFIRELCAHLSNDEINEAEENFWRYVETVRGIYLRLERERLEKNRM
ncbi:hypothetical protein JYU02_00410 [bacterium AH-315-P15]|nr:hypothetical protein [bacterium AH-315-P15]